MEAPTDIVAACVQALKEVGCAVVEPDPPTSSSSLWTIFLFDDDDAVADEIEIADHRFRLLCAKTYWAWATAPQDHVGPG